MLDGPSRKGGRASLFYLFTDSMFEQAFINNLFLLKSLKSYCCFSNNICYKFRGRIYVILMRTML